MNSENVSNFDTGRSLGQSYYLKLGRETIYGLSPVELEQLHGVIIDYFEREDEIPLAGEYVSPDLGQYSGIEKVTDFDEGKFQAWYNVSCGGELLQCLPAWHVLDLFLLLLSFLKQVEGMDIQCTIPGIKHRAIKQVPSKRKNRVVRLLEEGDVHKEINVIKEVPLISKVERLDNVRYSPCVRYDVQMNDRSLSDLSREQVVEIQHVIASFLAGREKCKSPVGG